MAADALSLYDGTILLKFTEGNHRYRVSTDAGKTWRTTSGVTTILSLLNKPALMTWPMNMALGHIKNQLGLGAVVDQACLDEAATAYTKKSDRGKDVGHITHAAIEAYLQGKSIDIEDEEATKAFSAFIDWHEDVQPQIQGVETMVFSKRYDYAGTFDALLTIDGKTVLADWKTTNPGRDAPRGCYPEYLFQLALYARAYEEEHGRSIDDLMIGNANKKGKFFATYASELNRTPQDLQEIVFNSALPEIYRELQYLGKMLKALK